MSELPTNRDYILRFAPRWLRGTRLGGMLYAAGLMLDALADAAASAIRRRFPGSDAYTDGLPLCGYDRRITRAAVESDASYALRLNRWRQSHRLRGNPYELLRNLAAHFPAMRLEIIYHSGRHYDFDGASTVVRDDLSSSVFAPTGDKWARYTIVFHWPTDPTAGDGLWGDPGTWGDGGIWGASLTGDEVALIKSATAEYNAAHVAIVDAVLLAPGDLITDVPAAAWEDYSAMSTAGFTCFRIV